MADADITLQLQHVTLAKHIPNEAVVFARAQGAVIVRRDTGRILPAMLQNRERVVYGLIDGAGTDYSYDTAHDS
jgi:hypothetical protein